MCDSFEFKELDVVGLIPGAFNLANSLTKRNPHIAMKLNELLLSGKWNLVLTKSYALDADTWNW